MSPAPTPEMNELPDDVILEIWEWLFSNKDMISLRSCCKRFKNLGDRYGFIRHLNLSMDSDYMNLILIWGNQNLKGVRSLCVNGLTSPAHWIPFKWPQHMLFVQCNMGRSLITPPLSPTTELRITDYSHGTLRIDWSKLPKLKLLEIYVYDVDFTGLEQCTGLEYLKIYLKTGQKTLPGWIANLKNLVSLSSNLFPETKMHFVSKKLQICLTPKRQKIRHLKNGKKIKLPDCKCGLRGCSPYNRIEHFTADSTLVPWRHLMCEGYTLGC